MNRNLIIGVIIGATLLAGHFLYEGFFSSPQDELVVDQAPNPQEEFIYTDYQGNEYVFVVAEKNVHLSELDNLIPVDERAGFYKDSSYIYWAHFNAFGDYGWTLFKTNFDLNTFEVLGTEARYVKDKDGVHLAYSLHIDKPLLAKVSGADPLTFTSLAISEIHEIFLDKNQVYLREYGSTENDLENLIKLNDLTGGRDSLVNVGYFGDANNTILLRNFGPNGYFAEVLRGVDAHSFEVFGRCRPSDGFLHAAFYYYKDKNDIYDTEGMPLKIDLNSLQVYENGVEITFIKDKDSVFEKCGVLMEGVDPNTFEPTA